MVGLVVEGGKLLGSVAEGGNVVGTTGLVVGCFIVGIGCYEVKDIIVRCHDIRRSILYHVTLTVGCLVVGLWLGLGDGLVVGRVYFKT